MTWEANIPNECRKLWNSKRFNLHPSTTSMLACADVSFWLHPPGIPSGALWGSASSSDVGGSSCHSLKACKDKPPSSPWLTVIGASGSSFIIMLHASFTTTHSDTTLIHLLLIWFPWACGGLLKNYLTAVVLKSMSYILDTVRHSCGLLLSFLQCSRTALN